MTFTSVFEIFATVVTALGGYEFVKWLVGFIAHRKQLKRQTEAETNKSETEADTQEFHLYVERIEELRHANAELNKQNLELLKAGARKDEIIEDKTRMIREIQEGRVEDAKRIGVLERKVDYYESWKCFREFGKGGERCARRKPAQDPPLKYEPIDDD